MRDVQLIAGMMGLYAGIIGVLALFPKSRRLPGKPPNMRRPGGILTRLVGKDWRRKSEEKAILAQWPTLLESMAIAVSAGMDPLRAFEICAGKTYGPLRRALEKVIVRLHSGMSLPAALAVMEGEGIHVARRLRATLAQAEALGTPVASVLEALAVEYYTLEKQRLEGTINSLPVKLSVVTVMFLLPPVLIISVMPHVLMFIQSGW